MSEEVGATTVDETEDVLFNEEETSETPSDEEAEAQPAFKKNRRDPMDIGATPSTVPRQCTDMGWLVVYFALSSAAVFVTMSVWPGQPTALLRLVDWRGQHCNLGANKNRSLLFFCPHRRHERQLEMWYPICVHQCPQGEAVLCPKNLNDETTVTTTTAPKFFVPIDETSNGGLPYLPFPVGSGGVYAYPPQQSFDYPFYRPPGPHYQPVLYPPSQDGQVFGSPETNYEIPPNAQVNSWPDQPTRRLENITVIQNETEIIHSDWRGNFTMRTVTSYPSAPFVDMVCKPWETDLEVQVRDWIDDTPLVNTWATLINSYWPLLVAAGTGIVLSYVYITLLRFRAAALVQTGMFLMVLGPLVTGLYYVYCWRNDGMCWASTGKKFTDGLAAAGGLIVGLTFLTVTCHLQDDIQLATGCIEWSCKAVLETPSLKLEPVMALSCRIVVDLGCMLILTMILTSDLQREEFLGLESKWKLPPQTPEQLLMLGVVAFWGLWTNWIITAISDFVIMYTTELWVFNGGLNKARGNVAPMCASLRGYCTCLRYHMGTMIYGGLVVGVAQPFRISCALLVAIVQFEDRSLGILGCLFDSFVWAYFDYLEPLCRNAYMDVALNARPFYESALHVSVVNAEYMDTVSILNGATWLFQLAGLGAIASVGHLQTCAILKYYPGFEDPYSPDYVQNPLLLSICGCAVATVMAFPFMMIFDTVSDTILYAYIVAKMRDEKPGKNTIYHRACGIMDSFGLNCGDRKQKDYSMPSFILEEIDTVEGP